MLKLHIYIFQHLIHSLLQFPRISPCITRLRTNLLCQRDKQERYFWARERRREGCRCGLDRAFQAGCHYYFYVVMMGEEGTEEGTLITAERCEDGIADLGVSLWLCC
jgi:hypothetical protein